MHILLTGASGFVGSHVAVALAAAGHQVRCATRRPTEARAAHPDRVWVELDLARPETLPGALAGCDAAIYLVHGMDAGHDDYPVRERREAQAFAAAAATAGLRRIIYLGGVMPAHGASR
ncbi:MAG: NAD(P)H-binding protein, partial [Minicystis sp.]